AHGAAQMRAGELVFALADQVQEIVEVAVHTEAQRPWRDLPVQDLRGDVGMVGRGLPPAGGAVFGCYTDKGDVGGGESLYAADLHGFFRTPMVRPSGRSTPHRPRLATLGIAWLGRIFRPYWHPYKSHFENSGKPFAMA